MTKSKRKPGKPITAHRLFPAFTGLWLAALFGLASFAVPVALLQDGVVAMGLPKLLPAAAPPLGFTARALVALAMTGLGGIIGLLVGLRLGRGVPAGVAVAPQAFGRRASREGVDGPAEPAQALGDSMRVRARDAHPDAPPRRPLTVSDDMLDETETRILADEAASAGPFGLRRLSGEEAHEAAFDPFAIYESDAVEPDAFTPPAFLAQALEQAHEQAHEEAAVEPVIMPVAQAVLAEPVESARIEVEAEVEAEDEDVGPVEGHVPLIGPATEEEVASLFARARQAVGEAGASPVASADLDGLGLVQLVERLALAIAGHRAALDAAMAEADEVALDSPVSGAALDMADSDSSATGLAPFAHGEPDSRRDSAVVPMARLYRTTPQGHESAANAADGETAVLEERYSSLVDVVPAIRRGDSARADEAASSHSLVIFPGQARAAPAEAGTAMTAPAAPFDRPHLAAVPSRFQAVVSGEGHAPGDPDSADQALRDALATLRRMTANR